VGLFAVTKVTTDLRGILLALLAGVAVPALAQQEPTMEVIGNLSYRGVYETPVTLQDGVYEGEAFIAGGASRPRIELVTQLIGRGDIDGDAVPDTAVLLTESSGGSGTYTYLALVTQRDGEMRNTATLLVGDRVQLRSLRFEQGTIVLDVLAAGPADPACCPSRKLRKRYRMQDATLDAVETRDMGTLSLQDIEGVGWTLTHWAANEPLATGIEVTANFADKQVTGSAGCNRYFAPVTADGGRDLSIGPAGSTRMACPQAQMEVEVRYLKALRKVSRFGFLSGQLALDYADGNGGKVLLFSATQPAGWIE